MFFASNLHVAIVETIVKSIDFKHSGILYILVGSVASPSGRTHFRKHNEHTLTNRTLNFNTSRARTEFARTARDRLRKILTTGVHSVAEHTQIYVGYKECLTNVVQNLTSLVRNTIPK